MTGRPELPVKKKGTGSFVRLNEAITREVDSFIVAEAKRAGGEKISRAKAVRVLLEYVFQGMEKRKK